MKQGDKTLEKFITQARRLVDDGGYPAATRDEMLRDTAVFGVESDKVQQDAIAISNNLTYLQVYDFGKTEESTEAQMVAIASHDATTDVHAVKSWVPRRKKQATKTSLKQPDGSKQPCNQPDKSCNPCYRCRGDHGRRDRA